MQLLAWLVYLLMWSCAACMGVYAATRASVLTCGLWLLFCSGIHIVQPEHSLMGCLVISITIFQDAFDITMDEDNPEYNENGRWPFQQFVDQLIHDMFDPSKLI